MAPLASVPTSPPSRAGNDGLPAWLLRSEAGSRELLAADVCVAVGDEPCQCLVQDVERAKPRRIAERLPGPINARGDAAEGVLAGGLGVLGGGAAGGLRPVDENQHRLAAETTRARGCPGR